MNIIVAVIVLFAILFNLIFRRMTMSIVVTSIILSTILFSLILIYFSSDLFFSWPSQNSIPLETIAKIGDSYNILTSIITSLTFAGLIWSIFIQKKELKGMQEEMKSSKFDNQFFQLLNTLNRIIDAINKNDDTFELLIKDFTQRISHPHIGDDKNTPNLEESKFKQILSAFSKENSNSMQYFFINLYQIIKYIDESELEQKDKKRYTNILRAQLSREQLRLLFYNGFGISSDSTKYMEYINKYALLEHLNSLASSDNKLYAHIDNQILLEYDKKAFGKNKGFKIIIENLETKKQKSEDDWFIPDSDMG